MKTYYVMNYKNGNRAIIEKSEYEKEMKEQYGIENLENDHDEAIVGVVESEKEPNWDDLEFDAETKEYSLKNSIKWVAQINGDDKTDEEIIKIGIKKIKNDDYPELKFDIVADNGDDVSTGGEKTYTSAIDAITQSWGNWKTFEWLEDAEPEMKKIEGLTAIKLVSVLDLFGTGEDEKEENFVEEAKGITFTIYEDGSVYGSDGKDYFYDIEFSDSEWEQLNENK